jgi:protein arginine N-methyltransferase 7
MADAESNYDNQATWVPPQRVEDGYDDEEEYYDEAKRNNAYSGGHFQPSGAAQEAMNFGSAKPPFVEVPPRLQRVPESVVNDVNDWHMPMMNDQQRNEAYRDALNKLVTPDDVVVEIGSGSGILSLIAAKAGAKHVYAIEASKNFAEISRVNFHRNHQAEKITIVNKMSTNVQVSPVPKKRKLSEKDDMGPVVQSLPQKCTLLVAEILGTMLDGESSIHYYEDARKRLLTENARIIPGYGVQYAALISSHQFETLTQGFGFDDLELSSFNRFRDSCTMIFSKNYGVLFQNLDLKELTKPITLFEVDYTKQGLEDILPSDGELIKEVDIEESGDAIAVMYWWEVYLDPERTIKISTHPNDPSGSVARAANWGQGIQLIEGPEGWDEPFPSPCKLEKGNKVKIAFRYQNKNAALFHARVLSTGS